MKSSLAFMGSLLVAFATGALINSAIESNRGTTLSHPNIGLRGEETRVVAGAEKSETRDFIPDEKSLRGVSGAFVPNLGQVSHDIYFQLIGPDRVANFRATSFRIRFPAELGSKSPGESIVDVRFVGANRRPEVRATGLARTRLSYVGQTDGQAFRASVPLFSQLTYRGLYDGVDLLVSTSGTTVTRRFLLEAGVSTDCLLLHYDGADRPILLPSGALQVTTPKGGLSYPPPEAFQERDGKRARVSVEYKLGPYGAFGFRVGPYDQSLPLMIDMKGL